MESVSLMFDPQSHHVGEVVTRGGALVQIRLTHAGEAAIGENVEGWQTRGVPVIRVEREQRTDGPSSVLKEERVPAHSSGFFSAMSAWLAFQRYHILTLESETLECWERMLHLPLSSSERFAMIYAVCKLPSADIRRWMKALDDAMHAVERV